MSNKKIDNPKITARPTRGLLRRFRAKCKKEGFTQDKVICEMMNGFTVGRIFIPPQAEYWEDKLSKNVDEIVRGIK